MGKNNKLLLLIILLLGPLLLAVVVFKTPLGATVLAQINADLNGDGRADELDLSILFAHWGPTSVTPTPGEPSPSPSPEASPTPEPTPEPEPIAILQGWDNGSAVELLSGILTGGGYEVAVVSEDEVKNGILAQGYDLMILPGGFSPFLQGINADLGAAIREFVSLGGGYIGICGGAVAGTKQIVDISGIWPNPISQIGLLDAEVIVHGVDNLRYVIWVTDYAPDYQMTAHPITHPQENHLVSISYRGGPAFFPVEGTTQAMEAVVWYTESPPETNLPYQDEMGIVSADYGQGKVVLFGPHPENLEATHFLLLNAANWILSEL